MMEKSKEEHLIEIGERYLAARQALGLTQEQAAELGDTTQQNISKAEQGKHFLASDVMYRLCVGYGITCEYLMSGEITERDAGLSDPRVKQLSPDQLVHFKVIIDHYFKSLGLSAGDIHKDPK